jgi:Ca2+-binding EF-hand superfamily protein
MPFRALQSKKDEKGFVTKQDFIHTISDEVKNDVNRAAEIFHILANSNDAESISVIAHGFTMKCALVLEYLRLDINGDGNISKRELTEGLDIGGAKKLVAYLDLNHDGKIRMDEFVKRIYQLIEKEEQDEERAKKMASSFDSLKSKKDDKGIVSKQDFISCFISHIQNNHKIEHIFKVLAGDNDHLNVDDALVSKKSEFIQEFFRLDKNYDTTLEKNEMINGMKALEIKNITGAKKLMKYIATSGDSKVTLEEYVKHMIAV